MSKAKELAKLREKNGGQPLCPEIQNPASVSFSKTNVEDYYDNILSENQIKESSAQYVKQMDKLENIFKEKTGLTQSDIAFLILAVGMQCARQYFLTSFKSVIDEKATASKDKENYKKRTEKISQGDYKGKQGGYYYAGFDEICSTTKVPYDTIRGGAKYNLKLGEIHTATAHSDMTPILGYFFGTMNILTDTLTTWDLQSFHIRNSSIYSRADTSKSCSYFYDRIKNDAPSVAAALIKQTIHIKSDMYTPNRIPLPAVSKISPELAKTLADYGLDFAFLDTVLKQAGLSQAINFIIAAAHRFMMFSEKDTDSDFYKVRTRKILLYSNIIASSSNILATCLTENYRYTDVGGFAVTLYRVFSDTNMIKDIKWEFINRELSKIYDEKYEKIKLYYSDNPS